MQRPWMKLYTRDYLDHKELHRCTLVTRGIWTYLLCLMAEGTPIGYLTDKVGPLEPEYISQRIVVPVRELRRAMDELKTKHVARETPEGVMYSPKMVEDESLRERRGLGGSKSQNNPHVPRRKDILQFAGKDTLNGYPLLAEVKDPPIVSSSSSSELKKVNDAGDPFLFANRLYARHPKKKNKILVENALANLHFNNRESVFPEIDRVHALWCATASWTDKDGSFAPPLDQWIVDEGWTHEPKAASLKPKTYDDRLAEIVQRKELERAARSGN